jgi:hypothetical protein
MDKKNYKQLPTFQDWVEYERESEPDEDGMVRCYQMFGIQDLTRERHIYLWRNYNTFDEVSTEVPGEYYRIHNGYLDCDACNELHECCATHLESRRAFWQKWRFGTKVFARNYTPKVVNHPGTSVYMIHDNGGRPFRVYVGGGEIHVYMRARNLIFDDPDHRRDFETTNIVRFTAGVEVVLAMNPREEDTDTEMSDASADDASTDSGEDSSADADSSADESNEPKENAKSTDMDNYYDQCVGHYKYSQVWIPTGEYMVRERGEIMREVDAGFEGNTILAKLIDGEGESAGMNSTHNTESHTYLYIGTSIRTFTCRDTILRYYSIVGNSDVPYPVAIGTGCIFFMEDGPCAEPLAKYSNLSEHQLADAYTYYYGHLCYICGGSGCACVREEYPKVEIKVIEICSRDW